MRRVCVYEQQRALRDRYARPEVEVAQLKKELAEAMAERNEKLTAKYEQQPVLQHPIDATCALFRARCSSDGASASGCGLT